MRIFLAALIAALLGLNFLLWMSDDRGVRQQRALETAIQAQKAENATLLDRNRALEAEVKDLKEGFAAIEERARAELGMVRRDETFFRLLDEAPTAPPSKPGRPGEVQKPATAAGAATAPGKPAAAAKKPEPARKPPPPPPRRSEPPADPEPDDGAGPAVEDDGR
ncbi:cell division protein FtsB [Plasticicumulans lactativorans]|uniref:Cell division protein FtsB n=1 Tax=Plasticicumulans lactativorans TaxID=1133106 RepID=A0A4R2KWF0_9GAMM|nr:cell division protein FtsB [Plasticicumulans lactativorans]